MPCRRGVENLSIGVSQICQTLEKGLRGFRAIAQLSVFSKWCTTVPVDLLPEETEWRSLCVGAERGGNCEHMQALLTNVLQRH